MGDAIRVSGVVPAAPEVVYAAWLDAKSHSKMTGGKATGAPGVGGAFTAWDGYITGTTLEIVPPRRIVQAWRTSEFPASAPDSRLVVTIAATDGGSQVTLDHTDLPAGEGPRYEDGWVKYYLTPMVRHFKKLAAKPAGKAAPAVRARRT